MSNSGGISQVERIRSETSQLVEEGRTMLGAIMKLSAGNVLDFNSGYQLWYTRALPVIRSLMPDRVDEFRRQYERDPRRKVVDGVTYTLQDFTQGVQPPTHYRGLEEIPNFKVNTIAYIRLNTQIELLSSSVTRLDDTLANLRGILQADIFDSELDAARHLIANGHYRAGGALAGVVLEAHLAEVCDRHGLKLKKRQPHISDFNEALKMAGVLDIPNWRWIQRLADIRNLCDHKRERDPTTDEVTELIDGVEKAIKTLQ